MDAAAHTHASLYMVRKLFRQGASRHVLSRRLRHLNMWRRLSRCMLKYIADASAYSFMQCVLNRTCQGAQDMADALSNPYVEKAQQGEDKNDELIESAPYVRSNMYSSWVPRSMADASAPYVDGRLSRVLQDMADASKHLTWQKARQGAQDMADASAA